MADQEPKRIVHCWEDGPETEDGCSTTCMLLQGHEGPHEWDRDDEIGISFAAPVPNGQSQSGSNGVENGS